VFPPTLSPNPFVVFTKYFITLLSSLSESPLMDVCRFQICLTPPRCAFLLFFQSGVSPDLMFRLWTNYTVSLLVCFPLLISLSPGRVRTLALYHLFFLHRSWHWLWRGFPLFTLFFLEFSLLPVSGGRGSFFRAFLRILFFFFPQSLYTPSPPDSPVFFFFSFEGHPNSCQVAPLEFPWSSDVPSFFSRRSVGKVADL